MKSLLQRHRLEQEIKKSRFIATALPISAPQEAPGLIDAVRDKEATHNCWAYRIGDQYRFSDDGEPGGTAGRPMLAAIEKQQFDRCLVVVTRFFGGIKLGAGGLARAYGGVVAECLRTAPFQEIRPMVDLAFTVPFDCIGEVYCVLRSHDIAKKEEQYLQEGVRLSVTVEASRCPEFEESLVGATRGRVTVHR